MPERIYIGNFSKGLVQNRLPFNIDNDAFPTMYNMYTWRGRAKRKRGTTPLGRLEIQYVIPSMTDLSDGIINLITGLELQSTSSITPGSISVTVGDNTYTEPATPDGTLVGDPSGTGSINYASGVLTIVDGGSSIITGSFSYYPGLPVVGLEDFIPVIPPSQLTISGSYPLLLAFDTEYSYQNFTSSSLGSTSFFNTNYFKNPPDGTYTSYEAKDTQTPFTWTGADYNLFWTTNFEQALWATNGTPGMQIQVMNITSGTSITINSSTSLTIPVLNSPAVVGDFVFINEVTDTGSPSYAYTLNGQTGYVTAVDDGVSITVKFPNANIHAPSTKYIDGIIQYLTNVVSTVSSPSMGDGIKWYDGDPTNSTGLPSSSPSGWVNFNPPLSATGQIIDTYSTLPIGIPYYLVGAKLIFPFKDRILFFGCYITTSTNAIAGMHPIYLQDTVIWSWNGSPYYTCSYSIASEQVAPNPTTSFLPIITPGTAVSGVTASGASIQSYYTDQAGFGGFLVAGLQQPIVSVGQNEDVLLVGFTGRQTRFVYTGNDLSPFLFFFINAELGVSSTFSGIVLDRGVITFGTYGFALTTQTSSQRIDLEIPDQAFMIKSTNYGVQRISSARDFYKEWLYFSYPPSSQPSTSLFPTQTFFYNYRDNTWAIFYENFTAHGSFWRSEGLTWGTLPYANWAEWTDPWGTPGTQALFPSVIAGNPQGYVVVKGESTSEAMTGYINDAVAYTSSTPYTTQITSYNHCVNVGDYIYITGCLGTTYLNAQIGQVYLIIDENNFVIDTLFIGVIPYGGLGQFARLSVPFMQSKQFPSYWEQGRQTRIGTQQYLLDTTANGQITLNIYLSMDPTDPWNQGPILPNPETTNNSLTYSQIVYTCPESTNIGLTPANTNLQMPTAMSQKQIWHRMNTSMIGDTVQFGITLNDLQMRNLVTATSEITLHAAIFDVYPSSMLS